MDDPWSCTGDEVAGYKAFSGNYYGVLMGSYGPYAWGCLASDEGRRHNPPSGKVALNWVGPWI